jgi:hypothetical protein
MLPQFEHPHPLLALRKDRVWHDQRCWCGHTGVKLARLVTVAVAAAIWPELMRLGSLEHLEPPEPQEVVG